MQHPLRNLSQESLQVSTYFFLSLLSPYRALFSAPHLEAPPSPVVEKETKETEKARSEEQALMAATLEKQQQELQNAIKRAVEAEGTVLPLCPVTTSLTLS